MAKAAQMATTETEDEVLQGSNRGANTQTNVRTWEESVSMYPSTSN